MKTKTLFTAIYLVVFFCIVSCTTPQEFFDRGHYSFAISKLDAKAKKGKLNEEEINLLLKSITESSNLKIEKFQEALEAPHYKEWKSRLKKMEQLEKRQAQYQRYPQLQGFELTLVNTSKWKEKFEVALYHHYHDLFDEQIKKYENGGPRQEVIKAYVITNDIDKYTTDDDHIESLRNYCLDLGHRTFKVYNHNNSFGTLLTYDSFLEAVSFSSNQWNTYNNNLPDSLTDYIVHYGIEDVDMRDDEDDNYQDYSKEVVESVRVETDTSGNETEIPVYETIEARVKATTYRYSVQASASLSIKSLADNRTVYSNTYDALQQEEIVLYFHDSGDKEAIPDDISLETFSIQHYNYDGLIEAAFINLGEQVSRDFSNGSIQ